MDHACRGLLTQRGYDGKLSAELMVMNSAVPQFFTFFPSELLFIYPISSPLGENMGLLHMVMCIPSYSEFIAKLVFT